MKPVITSNKMPRFADVTGVLASRFVTLVTTQSFLGSEDPTLFEEKLKPELAGILHLALEGLVGLRKRRRFAETKVSIEARIELETLGSDVASFVQEQCIYEADARITKEDLYMAFKGYCGHNEIAPAAGNIFAADFRSVAGKRVKEVRPVINGKRSSPMWEGIRLKTEADETAVL